MKLKTMKKNQFKVQKDVIYHVVIHHDQYIVKASETSISHLRGITYRFLENKFIKMQPSINIILSNPNTYTTLSIAKPSLVRMSPFYNPIDKYLDLIKQIEDGNY